MTSLAEFIASDRNLRTKFSTLHALWLEQEKEIKMSTESNLQHPQTDAQKSNSHDCVITALLNRVFKLEQKVTALEGKQ